ncbi:hypothetical protein EGY20_02085 [Burkholderia multivorans]|nr:hypothetical protein EGY20_02085 [Burkholderia multivorans]
MGAVSIVVAVVRKHDATYNRDVMRNNNRDTAHVKVTVHLKLARRVTFAMLSVANYRKTQPRCPTASRPTSI